MTNVSQEQLNDEQINQIADVMNDLHKGRVLTDKDHGQIEDLIVSHLAVNAELNRYKAALEWYAGTTHVTYRDEGWDVGEVAREALEGGSSNV